MKSKFICIVCLLAVALPLYSSAQENIQKAFDKLIKSYDEDMYDKHELIRDPVTGVKESQYDIYRFYIPSSKMGLVENIVKAFHADEAKAYGTSSGRTDRNDRNIVLAVGNGDKDGITITREGHNYIYSTFLAPEDEDPDGIHRYAYAMNWKKNEKGDTVFVALLTTYATTLKYRQDQAARSASGESSSLRRLPKSTDGSWFSTFMGYLQAASGSDVTSPTGVALATRVYEHTKILQSSKDVSEADKNTAREILMNLLSNIDPGAVAYSLLNSALTNIK